MLCFLYGPGEPGRYPAPAVFNGIDTANIYSRPSRGHGLVAVWFTAYGLAPNLALLSVGAAILVMFAVLTSSLWPFLALPLAVSAN